MVIDNIPPALDVPEALQGKIDQAMLNDWLGRVNVSNNLAIQLLNPEWQETLWYWLRAKAKQSSLDCIWVLDCRSLSTLHLSLQSLAEKLEIVTPSAGCNDTQLLLGKIADHLSNTSSQTTLQWALIFRHFDNPDQSIIQLLKSIAETTDLRNGYLFVLTNTCIVSLAGQPLRNQAMIMPDAQAAFLKALQSETKIPKNTTKTVTESLNYHVDALRLFYASPFLDQKNSKPFLAALADFDKAITSETTSQSPHAMPLGLAQLKQTHLIALIRDNKISAEELPLAKMLLLTVLDLQTYHSVAIEVLNQIVCWGNHVPHALFSDKPTSCLDTLVQHALVIIHEGTVSIRDPICCRIFEKLLALDKRTINTKETQELFRKINTAISLTAISEQLALCLAYRRLIAALRLDLIQANADLIIKMLLIETKAYHLETMQGLFSKYFESHTLHTLEKESLALLLEFSYALLALGPSKLDPRFWTCFVSYSESIIEAWHQPEHDPNASPVNPFLLACLQLNIAGIAALYGIPTAQALQEKALARISSPEVSSHKVENALAIIRHLMTLRYFSQHWHSEKICVDKMIDLLRSKLLTETPEDKEKSISYLIEQLPSLTHFPSHGPELEIIRQCIACFEALSAAYHPIRMHYTTLEFYFYSMAEAGSISQDAWDRLKDKIDLNTQDPLERLKINFIELNALASEKQDTLQTIQKKLSDLKKTAIAITSNQSATPQILEAIYAWRALALLHALESADNLIIEKIAAYQAILTGQSAPSAEAVQKAIQDARRHMLEIFIHGSPHIAAPTTSHQASEEAVVYRHRILASEPGILEASNQICIYPIAEQTEQTAHDTQDPPRIGVLLVNKAGEHFRFPLTPLLKDPDHKALLKRLSWRTNDDIVLLPSLVELIHTHCQTIDPDQEKQAVSAILKQLFLLGDLKSRPLQESSQTLSLIERLQQDLKEGAHLRHTTEESALLQLKITGLQKQLRQTQAQLLASTDTPVAPSEPADLFEKIAMAREALQRQMRTDPAFSAFRDDSDGPALIGAHIETLLARWIPQFEAYCEDPTRSFKGFCEQETAIQSKAIQSPMPQPHLIEKHEALETIVPPEEPSITKVQTKTISTDIQTKYHTRTQSDTPTPRTEPRLGSRVLTSMTPRGTSPLLKRAQSQVAINNSPTLQRTTSQVPSASDQQTRPTTPRTPRRVASQVATSTTPRGRSHDPSQVTPPVLFSKPLGRPPSSDENLFYASPSENSRHGSP